MSDQPVADGEARQRVAVLERIHEDCVRMQEVRHVDNRLEHAALIERLVKVELLLARLETRVLMISGAGAVVGAAIAQLIIQLLMQ